MSDVVAKFRCNKVSLARTSAETPEAKALLKEMDLTYGSTQFDQACKEHGIERWRKFDQPTVELSAVAGSPGNESWSSATPSGRLEMTISNPDAAEQFELGEHYLLRFEHTTA